MRAVLRSVAAVVLWSALLAALAQDAYFPEKAFSDDPWSNRFTTDWYSHELRILEEPSLVKQAGNPPSESYRFLWLRTFRHPVAVRVDLGLDGTGVVTIKVADGEAGFPRSSAHLVENVSRPLLREQAKAFLTQIRRVNFWSIGSVANQHGLDGAEWIVEGVRHDKYHVVQQWSPDKGPIHDLGLMFVLGMAQMNVPKDQIY